jgi:hypothetical protein
MPTVAAVTKSIRFARTITLLLMDSLKIRGAGHQQMASIAARWADTFEVLAYYGVLPGSAVTDCDGIHAVDA